MDFFCANLVSNKIDVFRNVFFLWFVIFFKECRDAAESYMGRSRTIFPVSYKECKKNVFVQKCLFLLDSAVVDLTVNEHSSTVQTSNEQNEVHFNHFCQNVRIDDNNIIINTIGNNNVASSSNNRYASLRYNNMYNLEQFSFFTSDAKLYWPIIWNMKTPTMSNLTHTIVKYAQQI